MHESTLYELADDIIYFDRYRKIDVHFSQNIGKTFDHNESIKNYFLPLSTIYPTRNFIISDGFLDSYCALLFKDDFIIKDTSYLLSEEYYNNSKIIKENLVEHAPGTDYIMSYNRASYNYYHWMIQILPSIDCSIKLRRKNSICLVAPDFNLWQKECLKILSYEKVDVLNINWEKHHFFPSIQYSEFLNGSKSFSISPAAISTFRTMQKIVGRPIKNKILYISRQDSNNRVMTNENELIKFLLNYGVEILVPSNLSVSEQIAKFSEALAVIGPHGAALSNLAFCRPGTIVYELFPEFYVNTCFYRLSQAAGLEYWSDLFNSDIETHPNVDHVFSRRWTVDLDIFSTRFREIIKALTA